jgi:hypothetical protein
MNEKHSLCQPAAGYSVFTPTLPVCRWVNFVSQEIKTYSKKRTTINAPFCLGVIPLWLGITFNKTSIFLFLFLFLFLFFFLFPGAVFQYSRPNIPTKCLGKSMLFKKGCECDAGK